MEEERGQLKGVGGKGRGGGRKRRTKRWGGEGKEEEEKKDAKGKESEKEKETKNEEAEEQQQQHSSIGTQTADGQMDGWTFLCIIGDFSGILEADVKVSITRRLFLLRAVSCPQVVKDGRSLESCN